MTNFYRQQKRYNLSYAAILCNLLLVCLFTFLLHDLAFVTVAQAATWPVPESGFSASLGFRSKYVRSGKTYIHSGVDILCDAKSQVRAPFSGTISFVGLVPSGDSLFSGGGQGQTMKAVSIRLESGKTLTFMPFDSLAVKRGTFVSEGDLLGVVASSGDRSSSQVHVHMGLKRGKVYYDPMELFENVSLAAVPAKIQKKQVPKSGQSNISSTGVAYAREKSLPQQSGEAAKTKKTYKESEALVQTGAVSSGNVSIDFQEGEVFDKDVHLDNSESILQNILESCQIQFSYCKSALCSLSEKSGLPVLCLSLLFLLVVFGICVLFALALKRFACPIIRKVYHKAVVFLLKLLRGDIMQKLFPASGDAFMPRGR